MQYNCLDFGGLAIVTDFSALDPWLCVADFHRLCLFGFLIFSVALFEKVTSFLAKLIVVLARSQKAIGLWQ